MSTRQVRTVTTTPLGRRPPWWRSLRHARVRWAVALVAALGAGGLVVHQSQEAADLASGFGARRAVTVARHRLEPGRVITSDDVADADWPAIAVADGALDTGAIGRVVTAPIAAGEPINQTRVSPAGRSALAALIPSGRRGVALPRPSDGSGLAVEVGDVVDVLAAETDLAGDRGRAVVAARAALIVAVDERSVTVAVPDDDARAVAAALAMGTPMLALAGPDTDP
jgi:Flp pilus assembly protein CpaB